MSAQYRIRGLLIAACLSGLWLGWIGLRPGPAQAAGMTLFAAQPGHDASPACSVPGALEGVDVSEYQGTIDWTLVAQTKTYAYARVGDGAIYTDSTFLTNYAGIRKAGMKAGAYIFFEPAQDPTLQANLLVSQLLKAGFAPGDLVPMFELEVTGGMTGSEIAASLQTAVDVVKNSLFVIPGIGSSATFLAFQNGSTAFASNPLWITYWNTNCPTVPLPWTDWTFWSYTDSGVVSGIKGGVDLGRSNGAALPIYTGGSQRNFLPLITRN